MLNSGIFFKRTSSPSGGGSPGGGTPQLQWNNSGSFSGTTGLEYDNVNAALRGLTTLTRGFELFNTADIATNTERLRLYWSANLAVLGTDTQGTGSQRELTVGTFLNGSGRNRIRFFPGGSTTEIQTVSAASSVAGSVHLSVNPGALTAASGLQTGLFCNLTANQSGSAGYTGLLIGVTETTTGSGIRNLLQAQVGGVNRFRVSSTGDTVISSLATNGLRLFNTADEVTNTESLILNWASNIATVSTSATGTGTARRLRLMALGVNFLDIFPSFNPGFGFSIGTTNASGGSLLQTGATYTNTSGTSGVFTLATTYNQVSSTAANTDLLINRTQTSVGSGVQRFIDCQVGGTTRFAIDNLGIPFFNPSATQSLLAANAITVDRGFIKVQGNGGAVTLTSTPTIAAGTEGQRIFIVGQSNTNTITLQDRGTLAGSNLRLGATTRVLGNGDVLGLLFDGSLWSEVYYANNL